MCCKISDVKIEKEGFVTRSKQTKKAALHLRRSWTQITIASDVEANEALPKPLEQHSP